MRRFLDLLETKVRLSPANRLTHTRDQPPIQLKATTIPTHNRIGRDDDERRLSPRPVAPKQHPKQLFKVGSLGREFRRLNPANCWRMKDSQPTFVPEPRSEKISQVVELKAVQSLGEQPLLLRFICVEICRSRGRRFRSEQFEYLGMQTEIC